MEGRPQLSSNTVPILALVGAEIFSLMAFVGVCEARATDIALCESRWSLALPAIALAGQSAATSFMDSSRAGARGPPHRSTSSWGSRVREARSTAVISSTGPHNRQRVTTWSNSQADGQPQATVVIEPHSTLAALLNKSGSQIEARSQIKQTLQTVIL